MTNDIRRTGDLLDANTVEARLFRGWPCILDLGTFRCAEDVGGERDKIEWWQKRLGTLDTVTLTGDTLPLDCECAVRTRHRR